VSSGKLAALGLPAVRQYHAGMNSTSPAARPGITWFVSRHRGAIEWAKGQDIAIDRWTPHLDPSEVAATDTVIGTLPVSLAAQICARGARYMHLSLQVPAAWRGRELSEHELVALCTELKAFRVEEAR